MPIFVAIGEYVAISILGLAGTAAVVVGGIVAVGAAFVTSRIINGNPNKGVNSATASQGGRIQIPPATNNKIPVVYGSAYVNGIITDARLITTDQKINNTMYYCIVLSETAHTGSATYTVNDIYWNDLRLVFNATDKYKVIEGRKTVDGPGEDFVDNNFVQSDESLVEVRVYAGGSAAANQIFPTTGTTPAYTYWAGNDGSWDSTYQMKGLVYAIVKVTWNQDKGFTGLPNMTFQLENSLSNPADVWYDYMTSERYGAGIDSSYIDSSAQTVWKNFSDEDITYTNKDGTTNQFTERYTMNGVIDTSQQVKTNIDTILQSGGAWMSYNVATGLWSPVIKKAITAGEANQSSTYFTASRSGSTLTVTTFPAGRIEAGQRLYNASGTYIGNVTAQILPLTAGETTGQKGRYTISTSGSISTTTFYTLPASILSFTDDNIISGITISSTRLEDLYNAYEVEFYDQHNKDQKAYARASIDSGDRNPNEPDNQLRLSLDLANNSMQADLLGNLELRQSRDDLVIEFTSNFYGIQAQAGDVISVTSDLYDWDPKYFRVMRIKEQETEDGGLIAQIQALEYNPDVYTIEPITEFTTSANIGIGVFGADPNLPPPSAVIISQVDADVAIPNFQLNITIPAEGGPFDEIELYYTEGWDEFSITGSVVPGTGSNGAPVGDGLLTVTATTYGSINVGDYFTVGSTTFTITSQITNNPTSKTFASGGTPSQTLVTLNNVTGLIVGHTLTGTGITNGAHILEIDTGTNTVRLDTGFTAQAAGTYTVTGGIGTYVVDTSATLSGTTLLYDQPVDSDYKYLKKITPEGNNPTFVNGSTITAVITEVPANSATYRRWYIKARLGVKKRFGRFSTPSNVDYSGGRFPYNPSPTGGGSLNNLTDVLITSPNEGQTLYYDATVSKWKNNSILEVDDTATRGGIVVGEGITQPMITFAPQPDGANALYGIRGFSTIDDPWFIGSGSLGNDLGYLEIAMGDNVGDDQTGGQIYVRQYNNGATAPFGAPWNGGTGAVVNEFILLDNVGYTSIPNRLAIGNNSPSYALDVTGSAYINENLTVHGSSYLGNNYITDVTHVIGEFDVTNNSVSNLFVEHTTGFVGINDNTPQTHLDIKGGLLATTAVSGERPLFQYNNSDAGPNAGAFLRKNYGAGTYTTGDGAHLALQIDSDSQDLRQIGIIGATYDATAPKIFLSTNINANTTGPFLSAGTFSTVEAVLPGDLTITGTNINTGADDTIIQIDRTTATTPATFNTALILKAATSGTPVVGYGTALRFVGQTTTSNFENAGYISVTSTDITNNSEDFQMAFGLMQNGATFDNRLVLDSAGNLTTTGDLTVTGNDIKSSTATAITLSGSDVTIEGNLSIKNTTLTLNSDGAGTEDVTIKVERGATDATIIWNETDDRWDISNDVKVTGDLTVNGNDIYSSTAKAITLSGDDVTVQGDLTVNGVINGFDITGDLMINGDVGYQNDRVRFETYNFNASTGTPTLVGVDLFVKATYRSAKYQVTMTKGSTYEMIDLYLIHDGTNVTITTANSVKVGTASSLVTWSATVDSTHVVLYATVDGTVNFKWFRFLTHTN